MSPSITPNADGSEIGSPKILGVCWVIYGAIRLLVALWLIGFSATATVMFGALLTRVPDPYTLMSTFHLLYLVAVIWSIAAGAAGIVAGLALLTHRDFGRSLAIVAAFLSLSEIPLGLTLSVYTLVVLWPPKAEHTYVSAARAA
jgi:hypothetical protein